MTFLKGRAWRFWVIIICAIVGVSIGWTLSSTQKTNIETLPPHFAIIPHHGITERGLNEFYRDLARRYPETTTIIIISPNHFNA